MRFTASMCCSSRFSEYREAIRARMLRDSAHRDWERRHLRSSSSSGRKAQIWARREPKSKCLLQGGPAGTAHYTDSCVVVFIEIAADFEDQLEIIADALTGATSFALDGRVPHIPSLVRAAAGMCWSRGNFCSVHSWFRGRRASATEFSCHEGSDTGMDRSVSRKLRSCLGAAFFLFLQNV